MRMTQDMDDDEKGKLFVGGLSWETSQENLQRYFSRYGEVIDCVVMKNSESGRSRGFGFVTFAEPSLVNVVLQSGPHTLDGRTIDPKPCNPRTLQKPKRGGGYPKVFLGGLPSNVTETDLRMFFARYGKVMEVVIMYDQEKKKSRGFGFLSFEEEISVERVTQEHFINLNGKQVEIKRAEPRDGSGKLGGSAGGGGGAPGEGQWGPPTAAPISIVQGHNGQMGGPPLNMPMAGPNIMQGYQSWGASPGQGNYNYSAAAAAAAAGGPGYTGWGAPPAPQPQWQAAQYQPHSQHAPHAAPPQTQAYGSYGQGYTNSAANYSSGPAAASSGGNWNNWNMPQNSTSTGSVLAGEVYGGGGGSGAARAGAGGATAGATGAGGAGGASSAALVSNALSSKSSDYGGYAQYPPPQQQPYQQDQGSTYGGQVRSYAGVGGAGVGAAAAAGSDYHHQAAGVTPHHHPSGAPPALAHATPKHFSNDFNKEWSTS